MSDPIEAEVVSTELVPFRQATEQEHKIENMFDKLKIQWEAERTEHARWKKDDLWENARLRIAAMMGAAIVSEGSVGTRPRADQVAAMAVEYADAIIVELEKKKKK